MQNLEEVGGRIAVHIVISFGQRLSDEVVHGSGDSIWSQDPDNQEFLEWHLLKLLPFEWQLFIFWSEVIVEFSEVEAPAVEEVLLYASSRFLRQARYWVICGAGSFCRI